MEVYASQLVNQVLGFTRKADLMKASRFYLGDLKGIILRVLRDSWGSITIPICPDDPEACDVLTLKPPHRLLLV